MADSIDTGSWDGAAAMSRAAASDDPAAAYEAICAGRRDGDPAIQSTWALPHHSDPGDPPNVSGVHNALSRINQAEGLTNRQAAQDHLDSHMTNIRATEEEMGMASDEAIDHLLEDVANGAVELSAIKTLDLPDEHVLAVDSEKRIIGLRVVRYNEVVTHPAYGPMLFEPGAFVKRDPSKVRLRMDHQNPPTGLGIAAYEDAIGPRIDFKVSKTQRGDEQLTLARDGVSRGTSPGFYDVPGRPQHKLVDGRMTTVYGPGSALLDELSTTWSPTFEGDGVIYVLSKDTTQEGQMADNDAPVIAAGIDYERLAGATASAVAQVLESQRGPAADARIETLLSKFDEMVELQRANFRIPQGDARKPKLHDWVGMSLQMQRGQPISPTTLHELALDDVLTGDNPGLVPDVFTADYDDLINSDRPFSQTTREIAPPATGMSMTLPVITQRAVAGTQAGGEKTDLSTTATQVGTGTFEYVAVFGGADIAAQMINRAGASFFDLLTGDLAMAYALDFDFKALVKLLQGYTDSAGNAHAPVDGGSLDPEDLELGEAWKNSILVYRRAPDRIWMNSNAVAQFIDAKQQSGTGSTGLPLYSNLAAAFTAAAGTAGELSGLRPVYVPALDDLYFDVDIIVGPSRGFVWAEDPALTLRADNPGKAGRDIALVGGGFFGPRFADAFTTYTLAGS